MSRETLDGDAAAGSPPADVSTAHPAAVLLTLDPHATSAGPPELPGRAEPSSAGPTLRMVQATVAVLVVAVLAGSLGVLVEQRRARDAAADGVRLVGVFLHDGSPPAQGDDDRGTAAVTGYLQLVNGGTDRVEVVGAAVAGIPLELLGRPITVAPGESGRLRASLQLPCSGIRMHSRWARERVIVDIRVLHPGGSGRAQRTEVEPLRLPSHMGLAELLSFACSGDLLVRVSQMEMDDAGVVRVDLRSESPRSTEVRVSVSPLMGARVNGTSSVSTVVPARGAGHLLVEVGIIDCERARKALGSSYELLNVEAAFDDGRRLAYLEGWQWTVGPAAFGFALARQCR